MIRRLIAVLILLGTPFLFSQAIPWGVRVGSDYMRGSLCKKVNPVYPPLARQARIQGTVVLQVRINKTGDVETIDLISGHPMLAPAAVTAVKQWKYRPYLIGGHAANVQTTVTVIFKLPAESPAKGVVGDIPGGAAPGQKGGIVGAVDTACTPLPAPPLRVRVSSVVGAALLIRRSPPSIPKRHGKNESRERSS